MTKQLQKAIVRRSQLKSKYLKNRTIDNKLNSKSNIIFAVNFTRKNKEKSF